MVQKLVHAHCNPELLKWARVTATLSLVGAAEKLRVGSDKLNLWESGDAQPSFTQLLHISAVYRRALPIFFLSEPPTHAQAEIDFRALGKDGQEIADRFVSMLRRIQTQRKKAIRILKNTQKNLKGLIENHTIHFDEDYVRISKEMRALLDIKIPTQFAWKDFQTALKNWKLAVEALGIFVVQNDSGSERIPLETFRGFVVPNFPFPIIAINSSDVPQGKIFTLMHELAHLIYISCSKRGNIDNKYRTKKYIEIMCNRVAAEILVPEAELHARYDAISQTSKRSNTINSVELRSMSARFSVSQEVILNRLCFCGLINENAREERLEELKAAARLIQDRAKGAPPYHVMAVAKNGRMMTSIVLDALAGKKISPGDASECLGVRIKHLKNVSDYLIASAV